MPEVNYLAVVVAAVSGFVVGGLWYSPVLFMKTWMAESGVTEDDMAKRSPAKVYGIALILCLIAAFTFALFLGPEPGLAFGAGAGFAAGFAWVAASFGVNYLFEAKSFKLFLVNGGYHTVQFTVMGAIIGVWS